MIFQSLIIVALSAIGLISAEEQKECPSKLCTRELEEIVYQPMTPTFAYLNRISEELKLAGPIFWAPQNESFIENFEVKYRVGIQVFDAFRNRIYPQFAPLKSMSQSQIWLPSKSYYSTTSIANMNGSGFAIFSAAEMSRIILGTDLPIPFGMGAAMYEFLVYSPFGDAKYINIVMPLSEAPIVAK